MGITRRRFLQGLAAAGLATQMPIPIFPSRRKPYVVAGQPVDYIGRHPAKLSIGLMVMEVGAWDGVGYPTLVEQGGCYARVIPSCVYYDHDLATLRNEYPADIWAHPENRRKYPNVQTYVRVHRFGETVEEAICHLNFTTTEKWLKEGWA
jgi:hypothetical protein